jgi:hypothetical protein
MKKLNDPQSGKSGSGNKRATPARRRARGNMSRFSPGWNELTEEERTAWRQAARQVWTRGRKGKRRRLRGQELYVKINTVLTLCGYEPRRLPPPPTTFGRNPVKALEITNRAGLVVLKLILREPPVKDLMVFGSWPRKPGQGSCSSGFSFLGLLRASEVLERDITELYLTKLKEWRKLSDKEYQLPLEGSRVFIRVWQQENGWDDKPLMQALNWLVPKRGDRGGG